MVICINTYHLIRGGNMISKEKKNIVRKSKKISAIALCICMTIGLINVTSKPEVVIAKANEEPTLTQFATKSELMTKFDADNSTSDKITKEVCFGKDHKGSINKWYIVGSEAEKGDNVVLSSSNAFYLTPSYQDLYQYKNYSSDWGCTYEQDPETVYPNHYGAGNIRKAFKACEADIKFFSLKEQALINTTTIATYDNKNNSVYITKDKLYLPNADDNNDYLTFGSKTEENPYGEIKVYSFACVTGSRTAYVGDFDNTYNETYIYNYYTTYGIYYSRIENQFAAPAFNLNIGTVEFASVAPIDGYGDMKDRIEEAYYLRYNATGSKLENCKATIDSSMTKLYMSGVPSGRIIGVVVQTSQGAYRGTSSANSGGTIEASDVIINGEALSSFENCKVWIEYTEDDIAYAKLADVCDSDSCFVRVDKNGGYSYMHHYVATKGSEFTLPECTVIPPDGNQFACWAIGSSTSNDRKSVGDTIIVTEDVVIYPVWKQNQDVEEYLIQTTMDKSSDFGTINEGMEVDWREAGLANYGTGTQIFEQPIGEYFDVGTISKTKIDPYNFSFFKVRPKTTLEPGVYSEDVVLKTDHNATVLNFKVKPESVKLTD